jgi:DNA polymerase-3 subunit epsilon
MHIREIILDTETTGLNPREGHRIVEIGALEMVNKVLTGRSFHHYINPERSMPAEAYRIHGISEEFLQDKPVFAEIAQDFLDFIEGGILVIHNAPFDTKFLNHELTLLKKPQLELSEVIDTLIMARRTFPGARASLDALCKRFKIDNSTRQLHGALLDAELLAEVYVELTGGRQSSFSLRGKELETRAEEQMAASSSGNKIIVRPTGAEEQAHEEFLKKFL